MVAGFEDFEIPCEVPGFAPEEAACDGTVPAYWIGYRSVICECGIIVRLVCNPCKVKYQYLMRDQAHIYCAGCEMETKGFDRFEPLRQAS